MTTRSRASLLKRLPRLAELAMQGSLGEVFVPCGTKTCICHSDPARRHGPHLYLKFRNSAGKQTSLYVPRSHEKEIRKAAEAWSELRETIILLSDLNREELRERVRRRKDE